MKEIPYIIGGLVIFFLFVFFMVFVTRNQPTIPVTDPHYSISYNYFTFGTTTTMQAHLEGTTTYTMTYTMGTSTEDFVRSFVFDNTGLPPVYPIVLRAVDVQGKELASTTVPFIIIPEWCKDYQSCTSLIQGTFN